MRRLPGRDWPEEAACPAWPTGAGRLEPVKKLLIRQGLRLVGDVCDLDDLVWADEAGSDQGT
ncbi:hypothetical protein GCM10010439_74170 [Actinocorallia aurantiaca]|uniref:Uncharacterized protein n=1 Tax=Actinocorallia aurantiaca TaxID=46204 RepID=A0ABN3UUQ8_9ACTN